MAAGEVVDSFKNVGLKDWLVKQCNAIGIKKPTEIQSKCIPEILKGRDCIGCAKTGSGKTAVFALTILHDLCEDPYGVFALILTPTRELAFQIGDQFNVLGKPINLQTTIITGGVDMMTQSLALAKRPHVVIATPGRCADHLNSTDTFSLSRIKYLVLDEADRLLDPTFAADLEVIFSMVSKKRQTLLFSATLSDAIEDLCNVTGTDPFCYTVQDKELAFQIADQFNVLGKPINLQTTIITGVVDMMTQSLALAKRPRVVIATPGETPMGNDFKNKCSRVNSHDFIE